MKIIIEVTLDHTGGTRPLKHHVVQALVEEVEGISSFWVAEDGMREDAEYTINEAREYTLRLKKAGTR